MYTTDQILLYRTSDGKTRIDVKLYDQTAWLTQAQMATLFETTKQNIGIHLKNLFAEGEIAEISVVKDYFTTASDGKSYNTLHYNLDAIIAVGYRVKSRRGIQFRQWATTILKEYLVKGFAMDDQRLKEPGGLDYFDEWLERIREIRASEKRFYQKVRDVFTTSIDYDPKSEEAQIFFKIVQNKMLFAVTGKTAAELLVDRADFNKANMGLTTWKGSRVRKEDVVIAKNYL